MGETMPIDAVFERVIKEADAVKGSMSEPYACYYCGDPATCLDHVIPHSFLNDLGAARTYSSGVIPACAECNLLLGAAVFESLDERRRHVAWKVRVRYKKLLAEPEWSEREIMELGLAMRKDVRQAQERRRYILLRLAILDRS
jgi:hypothetical protein